MVEIFLLFILILIAVFFDWTLIARIPDSVVSSQLSSRSNTTFRLPSFWTDWNMPVKGELLFGVLYKWTYVLYDEFNSIVMWKCSVLKDE